MDRFGVQLTLESLREAAEEWKAAYKKFGDELARCYTRMIYEAIASGMSVEQFAVYSGMTPKAVRTLMRKQGLDPKKGKRFLSHSAAEALRENAELLGIQPNEMDLRSPLAYLPMGSQLRAQLDSDEVKGVKEL